jgi:hypothetical protein
MNTDALGLGTECVVEDLLSLIGVASWTSHDQLVIIYLNMDRQIFIGVETKNI